jgi:ABC-2 type transport system permease protein
MRVILEIAKNNILDIFRDLKSNGIIFILPTVFIFIFGFLFSQINSLSTFTVAYVNIKDASAQYSDISQILADTEDPDGNNIFKVETFDDLDTAKLALKDRKVECVIDVNPDYFEGGMESPYVIYQDQSSQQSSIIASVVKEVVTTNLQGQPLFITENLLSGDQISGFQLQAAGLIVYGILIMIPQVAGSLSQMQQKSYLFRYSTSRVSSFEILGGFTLSNLFVSVIQMMLLFYVTSWFGVALDMQIVYAFIFIIPLVLFSVGVGLLIGAFVSKVDTASNVGTILSVVLGFLSGSFIVGIEKIGTEIGGRFISIADVVPTFYATKGMTNLIIYQKNLAEVSTEFAVITAFSCLIFVIGVYTFHIRHLKVG